MCVWPGIYVEQQSNKLMPHSGFFRFVLHKLHKYILKNKFPVSPSAMWSYHILYVLSSKRKPCWNRISWNQPWKQPFCTLWSETLLTTMPPLYPISTWNSSAPNQSPTMFEKADGQLCSVWAFTLLSHINYFLKQPVETLHWPWL